MSNSVPDVYRNNRHPFVSPTGSTSIEPQTPITVDTLSTLTIRYKVGAEGIPTFGGLRVYVPPGWSVPELSNSKAAGYTRVFVKSTNDVNIHAFLHSGRWISVEVTAGALSEGDEVIVIYGFSLHGGPGAFAPRVPMESEFTVSVDVGGHYHFAKIESPVVSVVPGEPYAISLTVPSTIGHSEKELLVRAQLVDRRQNPVHFEGAVMIGLSDGAQSETSLHLTDGHGETALPLPVNPRPGSIVVVAQTEDGQFSGISNPSVIRKKESQLNLFWGDIHGHSSASDGVFPPDHYYRYARDVSHLDFCALTDHDSVGSNSNVEDHSKVLSDEAWEEVKAITNQFNDPHRFATLVGYEYTQTDIEVVGHRNVYYRGDDGPLFRCTPGAYETPTKLFKALEEFGEPALVIPHHPLNFMSLEHHPEFQRLFEIYSMWGTSEVRGDDCSFSHPTKYHRGGLSYREALARGYRMGVLAGGDNHDSSPGIRQPTDLWRKGRMAQYPGLVAVYANELTREAVFDALWHRRCYGTTGERIVVDFQVNGACMGEEIEVASLGDPRRISVAVVGTDDLVAIDVIRNGEIYQTFRPGSSSFHAEIIDQDEANGPVYYYIRVLQENGHRAWTSPIWVDVAP